MSDSKKDLTSLDLLSSFEHEPQEVENFEQFEEKQEEVEKTQEENLELFEEGQSFIEKEQEEQIEEIEEIEEKVEESPFLETFPEAFTEENATTPPAYSPPTPLATTPPPTPATFNFPQTYTLEATASPLSLGIYAIGNFPEASQIFSLISPFVALQEAQKKNVEELLETQRFFLTHLQEIQAFKIAQKIRPYCSQFFVGPSDLIKQYLIPYSYSSPLEYKRPSLIPPLEIFVEEQSKKKAIYIFTKEIPPEYTLEKNLGLVSVAFMETKEVNSSDYAIEQLKERVWPLQGNCLFNIHLSFFGPPKESVVSCWGNAAFVSKKS